MIILTTHRQYATVVSNNFFPYIKLLQQSHRNNVAMHSKVSPEYLTVKLINSLLDEIDLLIKKKLITTSGRHVKLNLSDAHAITLYKTFLILPLDPADENFNYHCIIRQEWIGYLDKQIFK